MTHHLSIPFYLTMLALLVLVSAFFSGSETGLMSLNRYKLRHLAKTNDATARRVYSLIERPDRLLGTVLIGNTFANVLVSVVGANLSELWFGEDEIFISSALITLVLLIFAEILPKTLAAVYPQKIAFVVAWPLSLVTRALYPLVWASNGVVNTFLSWFGVHPMRSRSDALSSEELRSVVQEASEMIPSEHQDMLLRILDLESVSVDDIMVPRIDILGINLEDEWTDILEALSHGQHTRLVLYRGSIDQLEGVLPIRTVLHALAKEKLTKDNLLDYAEQPHFVPEGTPLATQLLNFRKTKGRFGIVVDEYGEILGLVTLEDILEEIVGEFTSGLQRTDQAIQVQNDGSCFVDGGVLLRDLNRRLEWMLPLSGPKTLSGLIIEHLEMIPSPNTSVLIHGHPIEIIRVQDNTVKTARIYPPIV